MGFDCFLEHRLNFAQKSKLVRLRALQHTAERGLCFLKYCTSAWVFQFYIIIFGLRRKLPSQILLTASSLRPPCSLKLLKNLIHLFIFSLAK